MRIFLFAFTGLIGAAIAPGYFRGPAAPQAQPRPYYLEGQPMLNDPNPPADTGRGPQEKAALAAHRVVLDGVYAAFDHPWSAMCALEQRIAVVRTLNDYYGERLRFERRGGWLRPDEWKGTAFDWRTAEDTRVEFLTRVSFSNRYFVMNELDARVTETVTEVVQGLPSRQHFCDEEFNPWATGIEGYLQHDRETARADALAQLKARWARSCEPAARKRLVGDVSHYYEQRVAQQTKLIDWGTPGLRRARALWSTEDDRMIDNLVRSMLREGYLSLDNIRANARPLVASLVDGNVGARRCPEQSAKTGN